MCVCVCVCVHANNNKVHHHALQMRVVLLGKAIQQINCRSLHMLIFYSELENHHVLVETNVELKCADTIIEMCLES